MSRRYAVLIALLAEFAASQQTPVVTLCARLEMEVAQMEPEEERDSLEAMGIAEAARDRLICAAYAALGLISFFTVGEDEVRAGKSPGIPGGDRGGAIHSDLARGLTPELDVFRRFSVCRWMLG